MNNPSGPRQGSVQTKSFTLGFPYPHWSWTWWILFIVFIIFTSNEYWHRVPASQKAMGMSPFCRQHNPHEITYLLVPVPLHDRNFLKLTWTVIYHWKLEPFFVSQSLSKTGFWLGVCHGWFHLHGLTRPVRSANRDLQNEKFLPTVGFETRSTFSVLDRYIN